MSELALYLVAAVAYIALGRRLSQRAPTRGSRAPPSSCSSSGSCRRSSGGCDELGGTRPRALRDPEAPRRQGRLRPALIGSYSPDLLSKWFVYGINVLGVELKADDPVQFHRGWPGVGFTHSLGYGVLIAALIWLIFGSRIWAWSFLLGHWAHALTDAGDTIGTMLFFPFSTETFGLGAWAYAGQYGRLIDAGAYFSGLGFVWDGVFVVYGLISWRMLKREYFHDVIVKADPRFWGWVGRWLPETALARPLPGELLLRHHALGRLDHLGARGSRLPARPELGRAAVGGRRLRLELAAQQRVHDEVDTALEPRVEVARAQDPLLREAGLLRDAPRSGVLLVRTKLEPLHASGPAAPNGRPASAPRAHALATRFGRNPVADLRDPVVGPFPVHADRADRLPCRRRSRSSTSCRSTSPGGCARCSRGRRPPCRGGDDVQELRDRAVVAGRGDGLDILLLAPRSEAHHAVGQRRLGRLHSPLSYDMQPV